MKFKSYKWLLWVFVMLTLIPPCVSAYATKNLRQGSEPIFSVFSSDEDPSKPATTPSFEPGKCNNLHLSIYTNRNRYYSPQVGRFISRDPIGFNGGKNLWGYV
ncbi:MAG: hypothetical protein HQM08_26500 [Candidatus Riflebacteria bacterium]|nr:hypothetical protein [Candidatus Riflebacteria bacterium]